MERLGSGQRFRKLVKDLTKKHASNPEALAAWIGRKKYGRSKFSKLGKTGRSRQMRKY